MGLYTVFVKIIKKIFFFGKWVRCIMRSHYKVIRIDHIFYASGRRERETLWMECYITIFGVCASTYIRSEKSPCSFIQKTIFFPPTPRYLILCRHGDTLSWDILDGISNRLCHRHKRKRMNIKIDLLLYIQLIHRRSSTMINCSYKSEKLSRMYFFSFYACWSRMKNFLSFSLGRVKNLSEMENFLSKKIFCGKSMR